MPSIKETCSCGAVIEYSSNTSTCHFEISAMQEAFHKAHEKCRQVTQTIPPYRITTEPPYKTTSGSISGGTEIRL